MDIPAAVGTVGGHEMRWVRCLKEMHFNIGLARALGVFEGSVVPRCENCCLIRREANKVTGKRTAMVMGTAPCKTESADMGTCALGMRRRW